MRKNITCIFIRGYDFPTGGASQNRLMGICKAMLSSGLNCEVLVYGPDRRNTEENTKSFLIYKGVIIHHYALKKSHNNPNLKFVGTLYGYFSMIFSILATAKKRSIQYIFFNSTSLLYLFPVRLVCYIIGAHLGRDINEYPSKIIKHGLECTLGACERLSLKLFDIAFIMTKHLVNYYVAYLRRNCRILILPMTVDWDRFSELREHPNSTYTITYCGDLSQSKDGVIDLVNAYAIANETMKNTKLMLIGHNTDNKYMSRLIETIDKLGISSNVLFTGFVHPDYIPSLLYNSNMLVLSRPDNIQAQGGFPTKLGEYLATGNPVVITDVGEVHEYLENEVSAFISEPTVYSFAASILQVYNYPRKAKEVGRNGKKVAEKYFSHKSQGDLIYRFLYNNL